MRTLAAVLAILCLASYCSADTALVPVKNRFGRVITYVEVPVTPAPATKVVTVVPVTPVVVVPAPVATVPVIAADGSVILVERPIWTPVRSRIRNLRK